MNSILETANTVLDDMFPGPVVDVSFLEEQLETKLDISESHSPLSHFGYKIIQGQIQQHGNQGNTPGYVARDFSRNSLMPTPGA